jgi:hypothetical protein
MTLEVNIAMKVQEVSFFWRFTAFSPKGPRATQGPLLLPFNATKLQEEVPYWTSGAFSDVR